MAVHIGCEWFAGHLVAKHLLDQVADTEELAAELQIDDGRSVATCGGSLRALGVLVPERFGVELLDVCQSHSACHAFLCWPCTNTTARPETALEAATTGGLQGDPPACARLRNACPTFPASAGPAAAFNGRQHANSDAALLGSGFCPTFTKPRPNPHQASPQGRGQCRERCLWRRFGGSADSGCGAPPVSRSARRAALERLVAAGWDAHPMVCAAGSAASARTSPRW